MQLSNRLCLVDRLPRVTLFGPVFQFLHRGVRRETKDFKREKTRYQGDRCQGDGRYGKYQTPENRSK